MLVQVLRASAFRAFPTCTRATTSAKRRLINQHRFNPIHNSFPPKSTSRLTPSVPEGDSAPAFSPTARRLPLRPPPGRIPLHIPPVPRSLVPGIIAKSEAPDLTRLSRRVTRIQPQFVCCGHHHAFAAYEMGTTQMRALNIIGRNPAAKSVNPGWCLLFEWDGVNHLERPQPA